MTCTLGLCKHLALGYVHTQGYQITQNQFAWCTRKTTRACNYLPLGRTGSTSITLCAVTTHLSTAPALHQQRRAPPRHRLAAALALLHLCRATGHLGSSRGSSSTTSLMPCDRVPRHVARLVVDFFAYVARPDSSTCRAARHTARRATRCQLLRLRCASGCLRTSRGSLRGSSSTTSTMSRVRVPRHVAWLVAPLVVDYFAYVVRPGASARRAARCRLLRLRRASGCLSTSRLIVDYFASRRLVVDYFAYATRPGALAHRAARHAARHATRHRLLHLRCVSGCLGTSRGSSRGSSSTTSTMPRVRVPQHVARPVALFVVNFAYATCPGASARCVARRAARSLLLRLRRVSGCLDTSCGTLSTSSPTSRVRVPQHVARLIVDYFASRRLVIDYFAYAARLGGWTRRVARHAARRAAHRRLLRLRLASGCLGTSRGSSRVSSSTTSTMSRIRVPRHVAWLVAPFVVNFAYAARLGASARRATRHAARS
jgi:hypothetical protein